MEFSGSDGYYWRLNSLGGLPTYQPILNRGPTIMCRFIVACLFLVLNATELWAQTRIAFVAGVERYKKSGLVDLDYAEDDARDVQAALENLGFKTIAVIGDDASLVKLNTELDRFINATKELNKSDMVVVYLSGHGVQKRVSRTDHEGRAIDVEEPFFCPNDAIKSDVNTLLSLNTILKRLEDSSGSEHNIIMLDACRDSADRSGKGGIDGSTIRELSDKLSLFFAAKSGSRSYESKQLEHGIFTHYLLEGLQGKAADSDNEITFQGLASYVSKQVERNSPGLLDVSAADAQRPNLMGNLSGTIVLGRVDSSRKRSEPSGDAGDTGMGASDSTITNSVGMKLVVIRSGSFLMGSPTTDTDRADTEVQHRVTLTSDYFLGETEVTQGQWKAVMGTEPWKGQEYVQEGVNYPATYVSWDDAVEFCKRLSEREGKRYRLPTEAEWEYACRGGASTPYSFGDSAAELVSYGWFDENANAKGEGYAHKVKQKQANPFGLYDMHGNVWEWCSDYYLEYLSGPLSDPTGPTDGSARVLRSGSWYSFASFCRSAFRSCSPPVDRSSGLGFRVAVDR